MIQLSATRLFGDFVFGEGLRWQNNRLWMSDMLGRKVYAIDESGSREVVAPVPARPNGLAFLPDGSLLIASMADQRLIRRAVDGTLSDYAKVGPLMTGYSGDLAADSKGRAYLDDVGYKVFDGESVKPGRLILAKPDGTAEVFDDNLQFPNGMWLTQDEKRLIFAEGRRGILFDYTLGPDGRFTGKRVFSEFPGEVIDGLTMDTGGAIWMCMPYKRRIQRVLDGGEVTHSIEFPSTKPVACCLGGSDLKTLYVVAADYTLERMARDDSTATIFSVRVEVPGFSRNQ